MSSGIKDDVSVWKASWKGERESATVGLYLVKWYTASL